MASDKMRVYFTVDVETSMGGAWRNPEYSPLSTAKTIFGQIGSRSYGLALIMDILEEHRFRATFFTEVFCAHLLGGDEVAKVFRYIADRGHDAQLHLHPVFWFYNEYLKGGERREQDLMCKLTHDEQRQLIREGVALFRELSGRAPRAYRAGCYGASEVTLQVLRENGILIDSSYNLCYLDTTCGFKTRPLNAPSFVEGVCEFPVTNFASAFGESYKALEISAVSVNEILATIRNLRDAGCRDVVLIFHSFSFLKQRGVRFEQCRPDRIVIRRFQRLCQALSEMREEVEVAVMGEVDLASIRCPQPQAVPSVGWLQPTVRKAVQGLNYVPWV